MAETGYGSLSIGGQQLQTINTTNNEEQSASARTREDIPNAVVGGMAARRGLHDIARMFAEADETPSLHSIPSPPSLAGSEAFGPEPLALPPREPHDVTDPWPVQTRPVSVGATPTNAPFYNVAERLRMSFKRRIYQIGIDQLIYYDEIAKVQKVNIASLQRFNIHAQQRKILGQVEQIILNGKFSIKGDDLAQSMQNYGIFYEAIRRTQGLHFFKSLPSETLSTRRK